MAGDPVCDAFRAELQTVLGAASIAWPIVDTDDGDDTPDGSAPYVEIRFEGGSEELAYWGAPGSNLWREDGQVFIDFLVPLGTNRDAQEAYPVRLRWDREEGPRRPVHRELPASARRPSSVSGSRRGWQSACARLPS